MSDLRIKLMFREATDRMADAKLLSTNINTRSDAPYLLNLLALEILLKCTVLISTGQLVRGHDYATLFNMLPDQAQTEIIAIASERMGPQAGYSNLIGVVGFSRVLLERLKHLTVIATDDAHQASTRH